MAKKKYEQRKQIKSARWLIFWVVLAHLATDMAVQAVVSFMENPPHEYVQIGISELIALGIPIMVYGRSLWQGSAAKARKELMLVRCRPSLVMAAVGMGIAGQFVMMLMNIPSNIFALTVMNMEMADAIPVATEFHDLIVGVVAVVIIPAVLEEFWLRGLVFRAYNQCNTAVAVIFTTLVFALLHMRFNEICGYLFMGFVSALILIRARSLYAVILYHGFTNLTALLFGFFLPYIQNRLLVIFAVMVIVFVLCTLLLFSASKPAKKVRVFRGREIMIKSVFSIPILLSICVVILRCVITA